MLQPLPSDEYVGKMDFSVYGQFQHFSMLLCYSVKRILGFLLGIEFRAEITSFHWTYRVDTVNSLSKKNLSKNPQISLNFDTGGQIEEQTENIYTLSICLKMEICHCFKKDLIINAKPRFYESSESFTRKLERLWTKENGCNVFQFANKCPYRDLYIMCILSTIIKTQMWRFCLLKHTGNRTYWFLMWLFCLGWSSSTGSKCELVQTTDTFTDVHIVIFWCCLCCCCCSFYCVGRSAASVHHKFSMGNKRNLHWSLRIYQAFHCLLHAFSGNQLKYIFCLICNIILPCSFCVYSFQVFFSASPHHLAWVQR